MNKWISVKDRLPDKKGEYICFLEGKGIRIKEFHSWGKNTPFRFWTNGQEDKKVTHWMPLPEPPGTILGNSEEYFKSYNTDEDHD